MSRKSIHVLILFHALLFLALSAVAHTVKSAPAGHATVKNQSHYDISLCGATSPACIVLKNERSQDVFRVGGNKAIGCVSDKQICFENLHTISSDYKIKRHLSHNYPSHNFW
jgi:hypothetical protein